MSTSSGSAPAPCTPAARPTPSTGARAVPIYQSTSFVFDERRRRREPLRAAEVRQHLLAASPTPRSPRSRSGWPPWRAASGRWRRRRAWPRSSSPSPRWSRPVTTSSPPPSLYGGTVTQLDVTLRRFGVETTFVPGTDPADFAAAMRPETKAHLHRDRRQPLRGGRRPRGAGRRRARRRRPAGRRRHAVDAVPLPAVRARRGHRHPLGHEVPRRARHHPRRRRRRVRPVRLGQRQLPAP